MSALLHIEDSELQPGVVLIAVAGKLMLGQESEQIETQATDLFRQGYRKLVLDLGGVRHIDSTGIGRFIASLSKVMQSGGKMRMAAATGAVRESFHVTRPDTDFKFYADVESAVAVLP